MVAVLDNIRSLYNVGSIFRTSDAVGIEKIYGIEKSEKSVPYNRVRVDKKTALIVGHEVRGLSDAVMNRADKILEIPMSGVKESLNVSVAFGIVVYSLRYNK